jgi:hypothetical protein
MHKYTNEDVAIIAEQTKADSRTIARRLAGLPVRGAAGVAIDRAIAALTASRRSPSTPHQAA